MREQHYFMVVCISPREEPQIELFTTILKANIAASIFMTRECWIRRIPQKDIETVEPPDILGCYRRIRTTCERWSATVKNTWVVD